MNTIRNAHCEDCPSYYTHIQLTPAERCGKVLHYGDRVCEYKQAARRFSKRDPKTQIPEWCPRRASPPILRVYEFKSLNDWFTHMTMGSEPYPHRYCIKYEGAAPLSAKEFWRNRSTLPDVLHLPFFVERDWIVEFDDGIRPICFRKTERGYAPITGFKSDVARANPRRAPEARQL